MKRGEKNPALRSAAATGLIVAATLALVAFLLHRALSRYSLHEIEAAMASIPRSRLALAGLCAAGSYACLTGFDALALRYVGRRLPYWQSALASFTALSLGHNIGFAALSSGAIRYRFYARWGLSAGEIAKVILFCATTVGLGMLVLAGAAFLAEPDLAQAITGLDGRLISIFGALSAAVPLLYLLLSAALRRPLRIGRWSIQMPNMRLAVAQLVVGGLNFAMVALCLYQLLAAVAPVRYATVATIYTIANSVTLATHVPGGLGVIEGVVLLLLPGVHVLAALLVFRFVYFLAPLCVGGLLFAVAEFTRAGRRIGSAAIAKARA